MRRSECLLVCIAALVMLVAGCTSDGSSRAEPESTSALETTEQEAAEPDELEPDESAEPASSSGDVDAGAEAGPSEASGSEGDEGAVEPLRPYTSTVPTVDDEIDTSIWVSRSLMTDTEVAIQWSAPDGAVELQVHRMLQESESRPDVEAMTDANRIHTSVEVAGTYEDPTVEAGALYWYGVRGISADGTVLSHGWHRTAAVTDVEPPVPVSNLTAEVVDGEIVVTWDQTTDNFELHAYRVLRSVDGAEFEIVVTTWNLDQTSFVDDQVPGPAQVAYQVVSMDFHWNMSEPTIIDVDLN